MSYDIPTPTELIRTATLNQLRTYWCLRTTQYKAGRTVTETLAEIGAAIKVDGRAMLPKQRVSEGLDWLAARGWCVYDQLEGGYRITEPTGYDQVRDVFADRRYVLGTGQRARPSGASSSITPAVTESVTSRHGISDASSIIEQEYEERSVTKNVTLKETHEVDPRRRARLHAELIKQGVYPGLAAEFIETVALDHIEGCLGDVQKLMRFRPRGDTASYLVQLIRGEVPRPPLEALPSVDQGQARDPGLSPQEAEQLRQEIEPVIESHRSYEYLRKYLNGAPSPSSSNQEVTP